MVLLFLANYMHRLRDAVVCLPFDTKGGKMPERSRVCPMLLDIRIQMPGQEVRRLERRFSASVKRFWQGMDTFRVLSFTTRPLLRSLRGF
jgi:hypothetical protein